MLTTIHVDDNWNNVLFPGQPLQNGNLVDNSNDTINPGGVSGIFGSDAFGTSVDGADAAYSTISAAIQAAAANDTVELLEGTYLESDIVIDRPLTLKGAAESGRDPLDHRS